MFFMHSTITIDTKQIKKDLTENTVSLTYGASKWNRTTDTGIFSPLLYRLSYQGLLIIASSRHIYI